MASILNVRVSTIKPANFSSWNGNGMENLDPGSLLFVNSVLKQLRSLVTVLFYGSPPDQEEGLWNRMLMLDTLQFTAGPSAYTCNVYY